MTNDVELLRQFVHARSQAAFAALVREHLSLVYFAALRRTNGDAGLAEDVAQDVFTSLAKNAALLLGREVLAGWLYVTTRHAAANAMRAEYRRRAREHEASLMMQNFDSEPGWEKLRPELDRVMDELNEKDRDAILLRFFENRPYVEISANFRVSEDAARMRVERALEKMRGLLARRSIASTAGALAGLLAAQSAVAVPLGLAPVVAASALAGSGVAAVATATVSSTGIYSFMATNKLMLGLVGAVVAASGFAVHEMQVLHQSDAELVAIGKERDQLRQLRQQLNDRAALASPSNTEGKPPTHSLPDKPTAEAAWVASKPASPGGTAPLPKNAHASSAAGKLDILFANPDYAQLELKVEQSNLRFRYGPLYRELGLTGARIDEFEALMLEEHQVMTDMFAAARSTGVSLNDPSLRQLNDPARDAIDAKVQAFLGPEGYASLRSFNSYENGTGRSAVDTLAMKLYATEAPIAPAQADRLAQLIAAHTPKPAGPGFMLDGRQPDWSTIYDQAREILSAPQLEVLKASNRNTELNLQLSALSDKILQESALRAPKG